MCEQKETGANSQADWLLLADDVVSNVTEFIKDPSSYEDVLEKLEDKLCDPAEMTESEKMPASIKGRLLNLSLWVSRGALDLHPKSTSEANKPPP